MYVVCVKCTEKLFSNFKVHHSEAEKDIYCADCVKVYGKMGRPTLNSLDCCGIGVIHASLAAMKNLKQ